MMCEPSSSDVVNENADTLKDDANVHFKEQRFNEAIELYSRAIDMDSSQAVFFGNRSFAYLKTEMFGSAIADASQAVKLDPTYVKGYYRRGAANMALGKFKLALKDFETVTKMRPKDPDAKAKFTECDKILRRKAFERAIAVDTVSESIADQVEATLGAMAVDSSYDGPVLEDVVTVEFMESLLKTFRLQGILNKKYAYRILLEIKKYFMSQPSLVSIDIPGSSKFTVCGDIHGQFYDLLNIFELNGLPSESNPYLFNGDFVDRGSFSVEVIFTLFGFKLLYPNHFFMARGNHESETMNQMYGFEGEVKHKYNKQMALLFTEIYNWLPLCHLINDKILVMHGGLFKDDDVKLADLKTIERNRQPPDSGPMCELLWSDPMTMDGKTPSKRGVGIQFGPDVTRKFCAENGLQYIIRSHEVKPEGYEVGHDGQCITVFSAPNYCDMMGNKGAFINLKGNDLKPKFTSFTAVDHPKVKPMVYSDSLFSSFL